MAARSGKDFGYSNDRGGDRTHDLRIKSPLLYRLSYPVKPRRKNSPFALNLRHTARFRQRAQPRSQKADVVRGVLRSGRTAP